MCLLAPVNSQGMKMTYTSDYRQGLLRALSAIDVDAVDAVIELLSRARTDDRMIFTCGNGGSAATASHFATDLGKGASFGRAKRFRMMALTDSMSTVTAYANDVSYDRVFAEQFIIHAGSGDVLVCISGSGNSPNVIAVAREARACGVITVALTGFDGGALGPLADIHVNVPDDHMGRIEDAHMAVCHMVAFSFMDQEPLDPTKP